MISDLQALVQRLQFPMGWVRWEEMLQSWQISIKPQLVSRTFSMKFNSISLFWYNWVLNKKILTNWLTIDWRNKRCEVIVYIGWILLLIVWWRPRVQHKFEENSYDYSKRKLKITQRKSCVTFCTNMLDISENRLMPVAFVFKK